MPDLSPTRGLTEVIDALAGSPKFKKAAGRAAWIQQILRRYSHWPQLEERQLRGMRWEGGTREAADRLVRQLNGHLAGPGVLAVDAIAEALP
jgi:hypothetical protein